MCLLFPGLSLAFVVRARISAVIRDPCLSAVHHNPQHDDQTEQRNHVDVDAKGCKEELG